jgi:hypothetical protein
MVVPLMVVPLMVIRWWYRSSGLQDSSGPSGLLVALVLFICWVSSLRCSFHQRRHERCHQHRMRNAMILAMKLAMELAMKVAMKLAREEVLNCCLELLPKSAAENCCQN